MLRDRQSTPTGAPAGRTPHSRLTGQIAALALCCCNAAFGGNFPPRDPDVRPIPTALESYAHLPDSRLVMIEEIQRFASADSLAVVSAVTVENPTHEVPRMNGVLVELESSAASDRIYLGVAHLAEWKQKIAALERNVELSRERYGESMQVMGMEACWRPRPVVHILCASNAIGPEGQSLNLSALRGDNFSFPNLAPTELAAAIGAAMARLEIADEIPPRPTIDLPDDALAEIIGSALENFPELSASEGIKAAGYSGRYDTSGAWVIFSPYQHEGPMAHTLWVDCELSEAGAEQPSQWRCEQSTPRSYLTLPGQQRPAVISGGATEDEAMAIINFARRHLVNDPRHSGTDHWQVVQLVPRPGNELLFVRLSDGALRTVSLKLQRGDLDELRLVELNCYDKVEPCKDP